MAVTLEVLSPDLLRRLHPSAIEDPRSVRSLLARLQQEGVALQRGLNREIVPEVARVERLEEVRVLYRKERFEPSRRPQLWLNFDLDGRRHFFASMIIESTANRIIAEYPAAIYRAERRDRRRRVVPAETPDVPREVELSPSGAPPVWARVTDVSASGLGVLAPDRVRIPIGSRLDVRFLDGSNAGEKARAELRHTTPAQQGWQHLGVSILQSGNGQLQVMQPDRSSWKRVNQLVLMAGASAVAGSTRVLRRLTRLAKPIPEIDVRDFANEAGECIRCIVDKTSGDLPWGAPVVLMPPAWGRTKETLLPLAATITAMFGAAGEAATVVRFDGIRKRGESYNDPDCREEGKEHHRFTFSQGVRDIHAVVRGIRGFPEYRDSPIVLVTFSAASIDGRRAVASDLTKQIVGWVSVVGSADLQSMMRVVSGGIDYVGGVDRGIEFGLQEILGVEVDIDLAGKDALEHRIAYLEDACRDLNRVRVPISWIHGRFDAWMDLERARLLLASGDSSRRRLIVVPTGHQLRTSREALEVFQLVADEIGRMVLGRGLPPRLPIIEDIEARRKTERARLPSRRMDRRRFWRSYLLGRDGSLGIELMTNAEAYRKMMAEQVDALSLEPGARVADLGSGTGSFLVELSDRDLRTIRVFEFEYVREALLRARLRRVSRLNSDEPAASYVACDLGGAKGLGFPCRDAVFDSILASLFISYVDDPVLVLREIRRVIKPRGTLVVSGLRRDADVSKLFTEALEEMARGEGASLLEEGAALDLPQLSRDFLNDATRLLDLEEQGVFAFRDEGELEGLLRAAGFSISRTWRCFGDPPQAVAVAARRED